MVMMMTTTKEPPRHRLVALVPHPCLEQLLITESFPVFHGQLAMVLKNETLVETLGG